MHTHISCIFLEPAIPLLRLYPKLIIRYTHVCSEIFTAALKVLSPSLKKKTTKPILISNTRTLVKL